mmetsp:Transcript_39857/g.55372  ORF Transcript_39857/g.55372 Transcript_39857/m.55372 type:complete len:176 (-) Transcript_39857:124-651(-)
MFEIESMDAENMNPSETIYDSPSAWVIAAVFLEEKKRSLLSLQTEVRSAFNSTDRFKGLRTIAAKNAPETYTGGLGMAALVVSGLAAFFSLLSVLSLAANCVLTLMGSILWVVLAAVTAFSAAIACVLTLLGTTLFTALAALMGAHVGLQSSRYMAATFLEKLEVRQTIEKQKHW